MYFISLCNASPLPLLPYLNISSALLADSYPLVQKSSVGTCPRTAIGGAPCACSTQRRSVPAPACLPSLRSTHWRPTGKVREWQQTLPTSAAPSCFEQTLSPTLSRWLKLKLTSSPLVPAGHLLHGLPSGNTDSESHLSSKGLLFPPAVPVVCFLVTSDF